jgi:hypothetical protein
MPAIRGGVKLSNYVDRGRYLAQILESSWRLRQKSPLFYILPCLLYE